MQQPNQHFNRAQILFEQRRYDLAETELRQAIGLDPENPDAYAYLALCLAERKQWQPATEAAQRAIAIDAGIPFCHYTLAAVLHDRNMHKEAGLAIDEALRLEPDHASYWGLRAAIHIAQKQFRDALTAAETGLELDAEHESCTNLRALALTNLGDKQAAASAIDATLAKNPLNPSSHANIGWTLLHQGEPRRAMEHFKEALRLDPNMDWARSGVIEAMKARSWVYRIFLAYFLFMGRLQGRAQLFILVGGYIAYQILRAVRTSHPALSPFLTPLIIAYFVFAIGTIVAVPLFNLFLLSSSFGRIVLRPAQRWAAAAFGISLIPPATFLTLWAIQGGIFFEFCALLTGLLPIPIALAGLARAGTGRIVMTSLAVFLTLACIVMCYFILLPDFRPIKDLVVPFVIACLGSTWVSNFFAIAGPKVKR